MVDSKSSNLWGRWCSKPLGLYRVGLWKNIKRAWGIFSSHTKFEVRDGYKVRFWHNLLCGNKALKEAFPYLYGIACAKDASVSTYLELYVGSNQWNISFARVVLDQEMNVFALIFNLLYSVRMK